MNNDSNHPVGFMGRVRSMKVVTWLLIIGLVGLTVSGTTLLFVLLNG